MIDEYLCREISRFGKKAVLSGLTSSRFGNISALRGDKIFITKSGSMLDELDRTQIVEVDLGGPCAQDVTASTETCVHRAVYLRTTAQSVIHTHSPYAVALSMIEGELVEPMDGEGCRFLGPMPVVDAEFGTDDLAAKMSVALHSHNACIARGHGVFAKGQSLAEAYTMACMAEHSSQVRYLVMSYRM